MELIKSPKFKLNLLRISLIFPIALFIILPLFLHAYKDYLVDNLQIGFLLAIIVIFVALLLIILVKAMASRIKEKKKINKVWPVIFTFFLIVSGIGIFIGSWEVNFYYGATHYNTGPVLTWGSNQDPSTDITIMWRTSAPSGSSISYTTEETFNDASLTTVTTDESVEWHQIAITGLTPNTKYYYRIDNFNNAIHSFTTAPSEGSTFNFLIVSDLRQNSGDLGCLVGTNVPKYMAEKSTAEGDFPEFSISTGDITSEGDRYSTWKSWFDDISVLGDLSSNAPLIDVVGNHERHNDPEGDIFASFYPLEEQSTAGQFYFSFDYGQIHFTMLDPWKITNGDAWWDELDDIQYDWARRDLQDAMDKEFRILCLHPPPLRGRTATRLDYKLPRVIKLANDYEVSIVFFGHAHDYEYNFINGTHYLLNGVGGNLDFSPSGYAEVKATPTQLTLSQHWVNGTTHDLAEIYP